MRRILIFTGEGKGKTTAALGMVVRAAGHGKRVLVVQFLKSDDSVGELAGCRSLPGVEIRQMGCGFVPNAASAEFERHREAAREALALAQRALESGEYDLMVLDEACVAVVRRLISEQQMLELLELGEEKTSIILTGRGATSRLIERADTVTEMRCLRHAYQQGIPSQEGVEY